MKPPINSTAPIWGIHAGKTGDAASLFISKNCVALGWQSNWSRILPIGKPIRSTSHCFNLYDT